MAGEKGGNGEMDSRLRSATVVAEAGKETTRRVPRLVSTKTVASSAAAMASPGSGVFSFSCLAPRFGHERVGFWGPVCVGLGLGHGRARKRKAVSA